MINMWINECTAPEALYTAQNNHDCDMGRYQGYCCKQPYFAYRFARHIPEADISYCQKHACKDPEWAYYFAKKFKEADIEYCYNFIKHSKRKDIDDFILKEI